MKLVGKYSVASGLRWCLGFINVFVMIAACFMAFATFLSLFVPDLATGFLDGLNAAREDPSRNLELVERLTMLGAFLACGFTWWVINRLRAILLSVNRGDAFELANVKRLQAIGFGLLGLQFRLRRRSGLMAGNPGRLHPGRGVPAGGGDARRTADHGLRSAP